MMAEGGVTVMEARGPVIRSRSNHQPRNVGRFLYTIFFFVHFMAFLAQVGALRSTVSVDYVR